MDPEDPVSVGACRVSAANCPRALAVRTVIWGGEELSERHGRIMATAAKHPGVYNMLSVVLDRLTPEYLYVMNPHWGRQMSRGKLSALETVLRADRPLHLREIAGRIRRAERTSVGVYLGRLVDQGLAVRTGARKNTRFEAKDPKMRLWRKFRALESLDYLVAAVELLEASYGPAADPGDFVVMAPGLGDDLVRRRFLTLALMEISEPAIFERLNRADVVLPQRYREITGSIRVAAKVKQRLTDDRLLAHPKEVRTIVDIITQAHEKCAPPFTSVAATYCTPRRRR